MTESGQDVKLADEAPIVRIAHTIIQQAVRDRASEIHVEPGADGIRVLFRIDGTMHEAMSLPQHLHQDLVDRYKVMAEMNVAERSVPQAGRIGITHQGKDYDLRVESQPKPEGERIVISIIARQ